MTFDVWVYEVAQIVTSIGVIFTAISSIYNRYEIRRAAKKVDAVNQTANGLAESAKVAVVEAKAAVVEARAAVVEVKAAVDKVNGRS
jgi:hypothetical protein